MVGRNSAPWEGPRILSPMRPAGKLPRPLVFRDRREYEAFVAQVTIKLFLPDLTAAENQRRFEALARREFLRVLRNAHAEARHDPDRVIRVYNELWGSHMTPAPGKPLPPFLRTLFHGQLAARPIFPARLAAIERRMQRTRARRRTQRRKLRQPPRPPKPR